MIESRIYTMVKDAFKNKSISERDRLLKDIPDGLQIGKKMTHNGMTVTYDYTEKNMYIMEHLHGVDIEHDTEELIRKNIDQATEGYDGEC